jgi:hypothetical protein
MADPTPLPADLPILQALIYDQDGWVAGKYLVQVPPISPPALIEWLAHVQETVIRWANGNLPPDVIAWADVWSVIPDPDHPEPWPYPQPVTLPLGAR